jgi:sugar phosphate isomerase/epimerase
VTRPSYTFGVSQFTTNPWSFEEDVAGYARLGVDTIEVCEDKLDEGRIAEQLALVGDRGLEISSVQPSVRTLFPSRTQPEPKEPRERTARFRRAIARLAGFAPGAPFVCNTGPPPDGNVREVFDVAAREYRELADFARDHGARVALEPLNPTLMNVETAIWTLAQAMRIVEAVGRGNFGICLDFWNVWQNLRRPRERRAHAPLLPGSPRRRAGRDPLARAAARDPPERLPRRLHAGDILRRRARPAVEDEPLRGGAAEPRGFRGRLERGFRADLKEAHDSKE